MQARRQAAPAAATAAPPAEPVKKKLPPGSVLKKIFGPGSDLASGGPPVKRPYEGDVAVSFGDAKMEPHVTIGEAQMEDPGLDSGDAELMDRIANLNAAEAVPYTYEEAIELAKADKLNEGFYGDLKKVSLADLAPEDRAVVERRADEILRNQRALKKKAEQAQRGRQDAMASARPGSDKRMKKGAYPASDARMKSPLSKTYSLTAPYSFKYKDGSAPGAEPGPQVGIMAQDLEKTPAGRTVVEQGPDGMKRVNSPRLSLMNAGGLHEVMKRLDALEKKRA
jgi:hypothetical protein